MGKKYSGLNAAKTAFRDEALTAAEGHDILKENFFRQEGSYV
jgi:hypothetical protein